MSAARRRVRRSAHRPAHRRISRGAASLTMVIALGCGGSGADPAPGDGTDTARLRVSNRPWLTFAPIQLAAERGFFLEEGLDVELVTTQTATSAIPLLLSGELDVLGGPITPGFFNAMARGARMRFVADKGYVDPGGCAFLGLLARPEFLELLPAPTIDAADNDAERARSQLDREPAVGPALLVDGRPPRISRSQEPQVNFFIERALSEYGLDLADFESFNVPPAAEVHAFRTGTLDIALASDPSITLMMQEAPVVLWKGIQQVIPGYQFSMVAFGPRLLDEDPELGRRFMVAYLRAVRAYNQGKTEENVAALARANNLDPELLRSICWMPMRSDGHVDLPSLEVYQAHFKERGLLDSDATADTYWDPSFVEHANAVLHGRQ